LASDKAAKVRRECAISLAHLRGPEKAKLWASLAMNHEAGDRWYLEALGIGASGDWDSCLRSWLEKVGDHWNSDSGKDIVWRSRAKVSAHLIAKIIKDPKTLENERDRYLRALDFQSKAEKEAALLDILK